MIPGLVRGLGLGKEGVLSCGIEKAKVQRGKVSCSRAHSKSRGDKLQGQVSKAPFILLTVGELSTEFHSENLSRWGQTKRGRGREGSVGVSSLSGDGAMEP